MSAKTYRNGVRALALGLALGAAAAPTARLAAQSAEPAVETAAKSEKPAPIAVRVKNDGWLEVGVYTLISGAPFYIGHVNGLSEATLEFPRGSQNSGRIQFLVDPIAGFSHYVTEPLWLSPGDVVDLKVADDLRFSTVSIEPHRAADDGR